MRASKEINSFWKKGLESSLFQIFITFLKISPVSFGGGYALIPVIEKEVVDRKKWLSAKEISDVFSLAQSAPGAIALNSAIFIGYRLKGGLGAIIALLGILIPTFFIMIVFSVAFIYMKDIPKVEAAFMSIRTTVLALIVYAAMKMGKKALVDIPTIALAAMTVLIMYFFNHMIHPIVLIAGGGVVGISIYLLRTLKGEHRPYKQANSPSQDNYSDYMI
ncbi:MAG TPA: chromate transporter [Candidatus Paenibacillus intestinavium]|nr:chromate transporter [Candidatus Paenibacillus intestinavium]